LRILGYIEKIMKVVHVSFEDNNGAGSCAYRICKAQRDLGIDSQLLVARKTRSDCFIHEYGLGRLFMRRVFNKLGRIIQFPNEIDKISNLCIEKGTCYTLPVSPVRLNNQKLLQEADIIHLHWVDNLVDYPSFFSAFSGKPMVWTLHDENLFFGIAHYERDYIKDNPLEKKYYGIKYESIRQAKRLGIVFLSKMMHDKFSDHEMISGFPSAIINNAVNYHLYQPKERKLACQRVGLNENVLIFAFCSVNISEKRKGLDILSKTLVKINPDYRILAIGGNPRSVHWDNVIEYGKCNTPEQMSWALSAANYFCMPSYQEAFAQTPIEAMACGLPIIVFPCSGTEELVTPVNGIRCEDFNSGALETGIREALAHQYDPRLIRRDAINRFSPERIAHEYLDFYEKVCGSYK
jgi:glycosyltransferase involved in cell wall biosynthesis